MAESAKENLESRSLSDQMFRDFTSAFRVAVIRGFGEVPMDGDYRYRLGNLSETLAYLDDSDRRSWFTHAEELLQTFLDDLVRRRGIAQRELTDAIAARLATVYTDPSLTIYAMAKEFDFSESSFYHFFRAAFGESFSDYVEGLRIREACARLSRAINGDDPGRTMIKDIASAVGFASDTTFRRTFHRVIGLSPSEYVQAATEGGYKNRPLQNDSIVADKGKGTVG